MILPVQTKNLSYDIVIEPGCSARAGELLRLDRRVLILTDDGVPAEYAQRTAEACADPVILTVPQGEGSKSIGTWERVLSLMLEKGFTRTDCVVAVGGGVVGDLAGFAASAYMRGVDFYNIPTTVLSQVDSSIGGKTAVNLGGIKNIVGAFLQPKRVLIDADLLKSLPRRQISNGLAEAVKMSLTADAELFELFEKGDIMNELPTVIERSLRIKKQVVEEDETEHGVRKTLNFGHTIGHGIECAMMGELYHGECVALGMLPMCGESVRPRLLRVLERLGLPTKCHCSADEVHMAMTHDKKASGDRITVTTVEEIGSYKMQETTVDALMERFKGYISEG